MNDADCSFSNRDKPAPVEAPSGPTIPLLCCLIVVAVVITAVSAKGAGSRPGIREKLLAGEVVYFKPDEPAEVRTIEAAWIREAALRHVKIYIQNAIVRRTLDASYISFDQEVSFHSCVFEDTANFSYAIFKHTLGTTRSTFQGGVFFQSATFEHDAYFEGTRFVGITTFRSLHVGGTFFATGAKFDPGVSANFSLARFDKDAQFWATSFGGDADFSFAQFGSYANFQGARFRRKSNWGLASFKQGAIFCADPPQKTPPAIFEGEADFTGVRIGFNAAFQGVIFERKVTFANAEFEGAAGFEGVLFKGNAIFNSLHIAGHAIFGTQRPFQAAMFLGELDFQFAEIGGAAHFCGVVFTKNADFLGARIKGDAIFAGSVFKGVANFNSVEFNEGANFRGDPECGASPARFEKEANFSADYFGSNADFEHAEFMQALKFEHVQVAGRSIFRGVRFLSGPAPSFRGTFFRQEAWFEEAEFHQGADFRGTQFDSEARFSGVTFAGEADFAGSRFAGLAHFTSGLSPSGTTDLPGTIFHRVQFDYAVFERDAVFEDAAFAGPTSFRQATFRAVYLSADGRLRERPRSQRYKADEVQEQFQSTVDLRGCTYQRIQVHWRSLFHRPDGSLRLEHYDRQPYTQLEHALRTVGRDDEADAVYLDRRETECELELDSHQYSTWLFDLLWGKVTNYGVRLYRLGVIALLFLLLGARLFSRAGAVSLKDGASGTEQDTRCRLSARQAFFLSLRCFLPVDILIGSEWAPKDEPVGILHASWAWNKIRPTTFAVVLRILGWFLVPVAIAAVAGVLKYVGQ
jgi:uncharacterized protein YjbI with pentapeptide repeats